MRNRAGKTNPISGRRQGAWGERRVAWGGSGEWRENSGQWSTAVAEDGRVRRPARTSARNPRGKLPHAGSRFRAICPVHGPLDPGSPSCSGDVTAGDHGHGPRWTTRSAARSCFPFRGLSDQFKRVLKPGSSRGQGQAHHQQGEVLVREAGLEGARKGWSQQPSRPLAGKSPKK